MSAAPRIGAGFTAILAVLLAFASLSTDLYLPAMPAMGAELGAGQGALEFTISGYLAGFALGQLFWGPVSDRFGRRGPLLAGLVVFVLGCALCALAGSVGQLIAGRLVQAFGASASVVLARAMVRDLFERDAAARLLSTLMTIMAIAPMVGPSLGSQILALSSWRAIFWLLCVVGLATLAAVLTLPETLKTRAPLSAPAVLSRYRGLFANRRFIAHVAVGGFFYMGVFAYVAGSPFAFVTYRQLSPLAYGVVFASSTAGLIVANMANARLVPRLGSARLLALGTRGALVFGLVTAAVAATDLGGTAGLALALFLFVAMNGFIAANAIAGALSSVTEGTGAASAVAGSLQYGGGVIGSALVSLLANGTPWPMGAVVALSGVATWASLRRIA